MGPPCNCQFCRKSKFGQCNDICETMRVELFNYFWLDLKSWEVRKQYVSTLVDKIPIKQKGAQSNSCRTCRHTYNYNLQCSRVKYQVCAEMFADTFGVSSKTIGDWISTPLYYTLTNFRGVRPPFPLNTSVQY